MKAMLAGVVAAILSVFGGHQAVTNSASNAAAAASAAPSAIVATSSATNSFSPDAEASSTIVYQTINQPVVERIVNQQPTSTGVSESELNTRLNALENKLTSLFYTGLTNVASSPASGVSGPIASGGVWNAIAGSQKIDHLSGTSLSNITVSGVSGLTTGDLPDLSGSYLSITSTSTARSTLGVGYASSANITNDTNIASWGDSLTSGNQDSTGTTYPGALSTLLAGENIYNGGVGGDTSTQIMTRMLAATDKYTWPTIIWAGNNNYTDPTTVEADIASMVAALSSVGNNNYIVLSLVNGNYADRLIGQSGYNSIIQINDALSATYGSHYLDVRTYLISLYDPNNAQDVIDHTNDTLPSSLRVDQVHLNTTGYTALANYIFQHISPLQNYPTTLITTKNLQNIFNQSININGFINTDQYSGYKQAGNTVLYASTTNRSLAVGASSAAAWMSATSSSFLSIAIGQGALATTPLSGAAIYNTAVGYSSLGKNTTGIDSTAIGANSLFTNTTGSYNTALGFNSLFANTTGARNTGSGVQALFSNTTGSFNAAFGMNALSANTTGSNNSAFGYQSLLNATTSSNNTAVGVQAMQGSLTGLLTISGSNNVALGGSALNKYINGSQNVAIGVNAMLNATTSNNSVAVGYKAGNGATTNDSYQGLVALGYQAGLSLTNGSDYNTLIGYNAGGLITTGNHNILIGAASTLANSNLTTGSGNIIIGYNISATSSTATNSLNIGNLLFGIALDGSGTSLSSGKLGVGTTTPWRTFSVTGTVGFDGLTGAFGAGSLCLTANKEVVYNSGSDSCLSSLRETKHDIQSLDLSAVDMVKSLHPVSFIYNNDASSTVRYGFIAEDTAAVDSHLGTYDQAGNISGVDDRSMLAIIVKALQSLISTVGNFADSLTTKELTFTRATGDDLTLTHQLCIQKSDGTPVCVTGDQLAAALGGTSAGNSAGSSDTSNSGDTPTSAPDTAPPVITINGENPAQISVGSSYADLGATVTDNVDQNLGMKYFLNGALVSNIVIDTSAAATDTIDYVATDNAGNTATSTRTVVIEAPTEQ